MKDLFKNELSRDFFEQQLIISKEIIEMTKPKVIIVNNSLARDYFQFETLFDKLIGTPRIINNQVLEGTPVFFTSMLTGQRALDLGSYERLKWHIKQVLSN